MSERGHKRPKESEYRHGPWSADEDTHLRDMVDDGGSNHWVRISHAIRTRSPKQCRERWAQNLDPILRHDPITTDEGAKITMLVKHRGTRWADIARQMPGRSDNAIKNWWNGQKNRHARQLRQRQQQQQQQQQQSQRYEPVDLGAEPQVSPLQCRDEPAGPPAQPELSREQRMERMQQLQQMELPPFFAPELQPHHAELGLGRPPSSSYSLSTPQQQQQQLLPAMGRSPTVAEQPVAEWPRGPLLPPPLPGMDGRRLSFGTVGSTAGSAAFMSPERSRTSVSPTPLAMCLLLRQVYPDPTLVPELQPSTSPLPAPAAAAAAVSHGDSRSSVASCYPSPPEDAKASAACLGSPVQLAPLRFPNLVQLPPVQELMDVVDKAERRLHY